MKPVNIILLIQACTLKNKQFESASGRQRLISRHTRATVTFLRELDQECRIAPFTPHIAEQTQMCCISILTASFFFAINIKLHSEKSLHRHA